MRSSLGAAATLIALTGSAHAQDLQNSDRIERGRYIAILSDCSGCHTAPGGQLFAGGLALETPFGKILAPNITPDRDTGIGAWTDEEFISAVREGRGHGGERLYPAMPYPAYTKLSDEDVRDLRAYFATIEPVKNKVISNQLPFPFNIRASLIGWNMLNFTSGRFQPNPQKSAEWNRGAYLVQAAGHCGTCHTPKTLLGGDKNDMALAGATLQGWFAPNITTDGHKGIGGWSKDDLIQYLKTGSNAWTLASGPMAEAVAHSTSLMKDEDIAAIATYLKDSGTGGNAPRPAPLAADTPAMKAGAAIYKDNCAACHKDNGSGEPNLFPRLAGSALVQSDDATTLMHVVLQGTRAVSTAAAPTAPAMPAFDWRLNDAQIAAVVTYIRNSWGNAAGQVPAGDVTSQRAALAKTQ
ncbi:MAG: cytochrome c [Bradyrhizobiaceae bacterium]|nr:MAG: cytochrome c [Bradyrhizobiaceae bacterium]